jgi:hypothetical protein
MGSFEFRYEGNARVSNDYREAHTDASGSGSASSERTTQSLSYACNDAAQNCAGHAANMVVRLREHADRL